MCVTNIQIISLNEDEYRACRDAALSALEAAREQWPELAEYMPGNEEMAAATHWCPGVDLRGAQSMEDVVAEHGTDVSSSAQWRMGLKEPVEPVVMNRFGELGCYLAHVKAWRAALHALSSEEEGRALILEDDALLKPEMWKLLAESRGHDYIFMPRLLHGSGRKQFPATSTSLSGTVRGSGSWAYLADKQVLTALLQSGVPAMIQPDAFLNAAVHHVPGIQKPLITNPNKLRLMQQASQAQSISHDWNWPARFMIAKITAIILGVLCILLAGGWVTHTVILPAIRKTKMTSAGLNIS